MSMKLAHQIAGVLITLALATPAVPALAQDQEQTGTSLDELITPEEPQSFATPDEAIAAFKDKVAKDDFDGVAALLGLDATKLKAEEGVTDTFAKIKQGLTEKLNVRKDEDDTEILEIGDQLWPFPFPVTKAEDGSWAFDTVAGLEEVINRRIGENELQAIDTARTYVDAQKEYASQDRDGDGVLEYAQKLISTDGQADGLYWVADDVHGESPAGDSLTQAQLDKASEGDGYFGYKFRVLTGQGDNIAGGAYDYVINGNMIAGFALIARPVTYEETGTMTFVVNQAGVVYQKDLGEDTTSAADAITIFNPDDSWTVVGAEPAE